MSLDAFLNQTCVISRPLADGVDRYNQAQYAQQEIARDVRCRLIQKSVKLLDEKSSQYTWIKASVLLLPLGVDVLPLDTVTVESIDYEVKQSLPRSRLRSAHHISIVVEALNG